MQMCYDMTERYSENKLKNFIDFVWIFYYLVAVGAKSLPYRTDLKNSDSEVDPWRRV